MGDTHHHYPLICAALCLLAGLALGQAFSYFPVSVGVVLLALGVVAVRGGRGPVLGFLLLLGALFYGQYHHWHLPDDHIAHLDGELVTLTATVAQLPHQDGRVSRFVAQVQTVKQDGQSRPVQGKLRLSHYLKQGDKPLVYGQTFSAHLTLHRITSLQNPDGFDFAAHMARQGIYMRAAIGSRSQLTRLDQGDGVRVALQGWRAEMAHHIHAALGPEPAAFLIALTIGDTRGLPEALRHTFQASGMAHVLAISGTHLGLVAGLVFFLLRGLIGLLPMGLLRPLTRHVTPGTVAGVVALLAATGYAALSGGRVPTLRALLMVWLVTLALLCGRRSHLPTALGAAALVILLFDPEAIAGASFQLSFTAVLAIAMALSVLPAAPNHPTLVDRLKRAALGTVVVTLVAGAATAPLVVYHFGQLSWPGFVANLILVPALGAVVLPVGLLAAVISPITDGLPLAGLVGWLMDAYLAATGWFAALPGALHHVARPHGALVLVSYGTVGLALACRRHLSRRSMAFGVVVLMATWGAAMHPNPGNGNLQIAFLDVGQGDATVVTGPSGDTLVIDAGTRFGRFDTGRLAVAPYLWQRGISHISVAASHPQIDHAGGLIYLLPRFSIDGYYDNGDRRAYARFDHDLHRALAKIGVTATRLAAGSPFAPISQLKMDVLHPPPGPPLAPVKQADNNRSLVLNITYGEHRILLTGDIETPAEKVLLAGNSDLSATILKVPHHGSKSSSSAPFLDRTSPKLAVMSAGRHNRYSHPHPSVLERYRMRNIPTQVTGQDGAVLLSSDGHTLRMGIWSELRLHPIPPGSAAIWAMEYRNWQRVLVPKTLLHSIGA